MIEVLAARVARGTLTDMTDMPFPSFHVFIPTF
jgi:hypothetical protein